ncbi:di-trans,poly-cis-decaprenylcistransferase [Candidatus Dojkabacteria bacterium]|nr:di-trans,poly-cis-decaprenylcistransferase [Candidatus Dojkabacteria bacterium]
MGNLPKHVVIIPDGNRRWARGKGKKDFDGHMEGVKRLFELVEEAAELGIEVITFWGFSTENWSRDEGEVSYLMQDIFLKQGRHFIPKFKEHKARFIHLGRKDRLSKELVEMITEVEEDTKEYSERTVCIAIDYGGRNEIIRGIKKAIESGEELSEENFGKFLDTSDVADPDMIVRTSGEKRLSGFMPWQSVYAELFFVDDYFPDFTKEKFREVVNEFGNRQRRFGGK